MREHETGGCMPNAPHELAGIQVIERRIRASSARTAISALISTYDLVCAQDKLKVHPETVPLEALDARLTAVTDRAAGCVPDPCFAGRS
jgi:hypothetical protein